MDLVHFATRIKNPTVITYHSDIIRQKKLLKLYQPLKSCFLNSSNKIIATSPNYLATSKDLIPHHRKTSVIPIGLDKSTYPIPSNQILDKWRSRVGCRFFLFVGVLRYYKGLHILIEAMKDKDYPLVIVGSGPIEVELKQHAARLKLKNIHFVGPVSEIDKIALLQLCYAVTFPSHLRSEAFGISLLEGAMYGKPLISSEIGTGTSYINIHEETGLVVLPCDPSALEEAITLLWENPSMAEQMGKQAEQRYWSLFTADRMAKSYVDVYQELINT
jgi:glycosyltransferase involved in cell wall biosynthesis